MKQKPVISSGLELGICILALIGSLVQHTQRRFGAAWVILQLRYLLVILESLSPTLSRECFAQEIDNCCRDQYSKVGIFSSHGIFLNKNVISARCGGAHL